MRKDPVEFLLFNGMYWNATLNLFETLAALRILSFSRAMPRRETISGKRMNSDIFLFILEASLWSLFYLIVKWNRSACYETGEVLLIVIWPCSGVQVGYQVISSLVRRVKVIAQVPDKVRA